MKKFTVAFSGLVESLKHRSVLIQFVMMGLALIASFVFKFSYFENLVLGLCIGLVIVAELLNTCIEKLCDVVSPGKDVRIKEIKDIAAGAVLFAAIVSLVLGLLMIANHI